jgi:hypothetical protein
MVAELKWVLSVRRREQPPHDEPVKPFNTVTAVCKWIESLTAQEKLRSLGKQIVTEFADVFTLIPHLDKLPSDVYCLIKLNDPNKTIATRSYSTPRKYRETWQMLIQQHLDAGCIRPSNSSHACLHCA